MPDRLLAMVNIFVESPLLDSVVSALGALPSVEELYEVTGEFDVVAVIVCSGIEEFDGGGLTLLGSEYEHRSGPPLLTETAQNLHAALSWKHEIKNDEIVMVL